MESRSLKEYYHTIKALQQNVLLLFNAITLICRDMGPAVNGQLLLIDITHTRGARYKVTKTISMHVRKVIWYLLCSLEPFGWHLKTTCPTQS